MNYIHVCRTNRIATKTPHRHHPPKWADQFLQWYCRPDLLEEIQGDTYELFYRSASKNRLKANAQFVWNVVRFFKWKNIKRPTQQRANNMDMLQHYLKLGSRNLLKNRNYALLNVSGLAIAFGAVLMIALYLHFELTFDTQHANHKNTYRVVAVSTTDATQGLAKVAGPIGPAILESDPSVKIFARLAVAGSSLLASNNVKSYEQGGFYADSTLFDVFAFNIIEGDEATMLSAPNSIVLSSELSKKYFGGEPALGKLITLNNETTLMVTGVVENQRDNTHLSFSFFMPTEADKRGWTEIWDRPQHYTYLVLEQHANPSLIAEEITSIVTKNAKPDQIINGTLLQPVTSIHLHSNLLREIHPNGNIRSIYTYLSVAILILVIASINFTNIFTARAGERLKEIGMRKISGAKRGELVRQFLSESFMLTLVAALAGVGICYVSLPFFKTIVGAPLHFVDILNPLFVGASFATLVVVALMAGSYPAFFLAGMKPMVLQRGPTVKRGLSRELLVVIQFAISTFLIAALAVVSGQTDYMETKPLGFTKDNIIVIPIRDSETLAARDVIIEKLSSNPHIEGVSFSGTSLGGGDWGVPVVPEGVDLEKMPSTRVMVVDENFADTYQMKFLEGRNFSKSIPADVDHGVLINARAAKAFGWDKNIIGRRISIPAAEKTTQVIGVVDDFHFRSLHEEIQPVVFFMQPAWFGNVSIRLDGTANPETIEVIAALWKNYEASYPFTYNYFDQALDTLYQDDRNTRKLISWSGALAVFLACIGLFSLTAYHASRRSHEFGIRKVLGASVATIVGLQLKAYAIVAAIGSVVACGVAWLAMSKWLTSFAYRIELTPVFFIWSILLSVGVALATALYQSFRSALVNPVDSIRSGQ